MVWSIECKLPYGKKVANSVSFRAPHYKYTLNAPQNRILVTTDPSIRMVGLGVSPEALFFENAANSKPQASDATWRVGGLSN